jgi:hypothetical protein
MKKHIAKAVSILSLFVTLSVGAVSASAQTGLMTAAIPFDFTIGKKTLPAGRYEIDRGAITGHMVIRSKDNREAMVFSTSSVEAKKTPGKGYLMFHRYGSQYFLRRVWMPGNGTGCELPPSRPERKLINERNLAQKATEPEEVHIAMR